MSHNSTEYCFIARDISWQRNSSLGRYQLATKIMRLDTISLFLSGYAKDPVYADKPATREQLETNFRQVLTEIPPNMCQKVFENYLKRVNACNTWRGDHLYAVVLHTERQHSKFTIKKKFKCVLFTFTFATM